MRYIATTSTPNWDPKIKRRVLSRLQTDGCLAYPIPQQVVRTSQNSCFSSWIIALPTGDELEIRRTVRNSGIFDFSRADKYKIITPGYPKAVLYEEETQKVFLEFYDALRPDRPKIYALPAAVFYHLYQKTPTTS